MKRFEYEECCLLERLELSFNGGWAKEYLLQTQLSELSEYGWEVVFLKEIIRHKNRTLYKVIFKREIASP